MRYTSVPLSVGTPLRAAPPANLVMRRYESFGVLPTSPPIAKLPSYDLQTSKNAPTREIWSVLNRLDTTVEG